jgi:LruC domain-containing protein
LEKKETNYNSIKQRNTKIMKHFNLYLLCSLLLVLSACETNDIETQESDSGVQNLQNLSIPDGFDFSTERTVTLTINDETPNVKYEIFGYRSSLGNEAENIADALNNILYSGKPTAGSINHVIGLSNQYDKVYISRKDGIEYSFEIKDIDNNIINFTSALEVKSKNKPVVSSGNRTILCGDCTEIYTNGDFEANIPQNLPKANRSVQTNENNIDGWFTTADDFLIELWGSPFNGVISQSGGAHAELNATQASALYQRVCTTPNAVIDWSVWHRGRDGVDVATVKFGNDLLTAQTVQVMESSNFEGYVNGNGYEALAGGNGWINYTGQYTVPAGQNDTFLIFEAVSAVGGTSKGNFIDNIEVSEVSAGDPCGGGTITYPGGLEPANLAFEDLWPSQGDYDFNDLVISYRIIQNLDGLGGVESMEYIYNVKNIGASYNNGFAVELVGVPAAAISSIEGQLDGNSGATVGANGAVIKFFNKANNYLGQAQAITINFSPAITLGTGAGELDVPPYNPFLIANVGSDPSSVYEVHLPGELYSGTTQPTTLPAFFPGAFLNPTNDDADGDYMVNAGVTLDIPPVTDMVNMPWAMNISGTYVSPIPGAFIMKGHLKFQSWAQSGGTADTDWFLNLSGYRDSTFLDNN